MPATLQPHLANVFPWRHEIADSESKSPNELQYKNEKQLSQSGVVVSGYANIRLSEGGKKNWGKGFNSSVPLNLLAAPAPPPSRCIPKVNKTCFWY